MVIHSCIGSIDIGQFFNEAHSRSCLLENRHADCHVVCCPKILAFLVSKVLFSDVLEEPRVESSEMAGYKWKLTV